MGRQSESLDIPVTTNTFELVDQLEKAGDDVVVFCTYQSADVVSNAVKKIKYIFDLIVFDEAHRTAGSASSDQFSLALTNENISSKKRLFMTATERLVRPQVKSAVTSAGRIIFSMDDENIYGPVFYRLNFGDAIQEGIISDYRIILAGISEEEIQALVRTNKFLQEEAHGEVISSQDLFKRLLILKSIQELDLNKVITFHSSIKEAKAFTNFIDNYAFNFGIEITPLHINGSFKSNQRKSIFISSRYQKRSFE